MKLRLAPLPSLLAAIAVPVLGILPIPAHAGHGPLRPPTMASDEDPSGARVIVMYKAQGGLMKALRAGAMPAPGPQYAATLARHTGLALTDGRIVEGRTQVVRGDRSLSSTALAARLAADPEVEFAVPDRRRYPLGAAPNDLLYAASASISPLVGQWYLRAPDATFVAAIDAPAAWNVSTGSASIVVADIDTGVRFGHPDLANKLYPGYDFIADAAIANDGDGADGNASDPGDWITAAEANDRTSQFYQCGVYNATTGKYDAEPSSWHGTQTASLIGAQTNNALGMASVGHHVMVLPVRVLGKCGGYDSDIVAGMLWAGGVSSVPYVNPNPARVINLSLGGSGSCGTLYATAVGRLTAAGVVVVAAAGNDEGLAVSEPANCAGVIAVAGVRHSGTKVGYSNVGPEVSIAAPAGNCGALTGPCLYPILTATNSGTTTPAAATYSDSTNYSVGTSFSSPIVAGTVALMLAANPALTPTQVKSLLTGNARAFPTTSTDPTVQQCHAPSAAKQDECLCTTSTCGAGLLDAGAAVAAASALASPPVAAISSSSATPLVGSTVTLDGGISTGSPVAYSWAITAGAGLASFTTPAAQPSVGLGITGAGVVKVSLMVTDGTGASSTASVVLAATQPPAADIKVAPAAPAAGTRVTLDGSGSTAYAAGGRTITGYQWAITSGSSVAAFSGGTTAATATVNTKSAGSFTVQLTVTDSAGAQATQTATVNVGAAVGGGGGGAASLLWVLGVLLAAVVLRFMAPPAPPRA